MPGQYNYPGANVPGVPGVPNQMPEGMTPLQQQIWMKAFGRGIPGVTGTRPALVDLLCTAPYNVYLACKLAICHWEVSNTEFT